MTTPAAAATAGRRFRPAPILGGPMAEVELVSRYLLDGGSAADNVGTVNGTVAGAWTAFDTTSLVVGVAGTSFYKDGGAAHITLPASQPAHTLGMLSLSFYYQPSGSLNKHTLFAASDNLSTGIGDLSIERLTNGRLRGFHVGQDGGLRFFESSDGIAATNLVEGTAYRITLTLGPGGAKLYLDDAEVAVILENTNGWNNARTKFFGVWVDGSASPAQGVFDHIRLWEGELSLNGVQVQQDAQETIIPVSELNDDTFQSFDDFTGPVVQTFTGDQGHNTFSIAGSDAVTLTPQSRIDARGSTWRQPAPPTQIFQANMGGNFQNPPDNAICWVGGLWLGETPLDATYDDIKPVGSKALMINSHGGIIDGVRLHNTHEDAITVSHGEHAAREPHVMSFIRNCWISLTLGDAIENDHVANLTIDDCLLDEIYEPVSVDPGGQYNGNGEEAANLLVITNSLLRTRSAGSEGTANYFGWVKTRNQGPQTCPNTEMHNCLLAFDGWATSFDWDNPPGSGGGGPPGRWGLFLSRLQAASNNRVLWLLDTDPPWVSHPASWPPLPSGFIRETGAQARATWEAAKQNWIDSHPQVAHAPGDPVSNPANADPNAYGGGGS